MDSLIASDAHSRDVIADLVKEVNPFPKPYSVELIGAAEEGSASEG